MLEVFDAFARYLPTPLILLTKEGRLLAANPAAAEAFRPVPLEPGQSIHALIQPTIDFAGYLDMCLGSLTPLPSRFQPVFGEANRFFLCKAARLLIGTEEPCILLRFWERKQTDAFLLLGQKVKELNEEILRRQQLERELRRLAGSLETQVEKRTRELHEAEEALRQSQKMEAIGQLTGGIAHDFNNLLQGITGALSLAERRLAEGRTADVTRLLALATESANRAAALTHRLLAVSRRQPLAPKPVRMEQLLAAIGELLQHTLGERIALEIRLAADLSPALCDPHQLEAAVLNLVINARDAMPDGGRLLIEANEVHFAPDQAAAFEVGPGRYIRLAVVDTGMGMPSEVVARVFEPFFTTKPMGKGTGLGLPIVHGFIRQSGGCIDIASVEGQGTRVCLYLPVAPHVAERKSDDVPMTAAPARQEAVVLVVEDEATVRGLIVELLQGQGYVTLEAGNGLEGLEILRSPMRIDLLLTDMGLPGLSGQQMVEAARHIRRDLMVLFMTGYVENLAAIDFLAPGTELISKPFSLEALAVRIRAMTSKSRYMRA